MTFQGLWCEADDHGRGIADHRLLKGTLWPLDDEVDADAVGHHLDQLEETGHVRLYAVGGERYYEIVEWEKHQSASHRRGESLHPLPPAETPDGDTTHDQSCKKVQDALPVMPESARVRARAGGAVSSEQGTGNRELGTEPSDEVDRGLALVLPAPSTTSTDTETVWDAWKEATGHHRAKFDTKRERVILRALRNYPVADCVDAVRGWKHSKHHRGENATGTVYDDISLLLRDSERLERFRDLERGDRAAPATKQPKTWDGLARVMAQRNGDVTT